MAWFLVVHLVCLCLICCELPSGVALPTVGVVSGCVVWEVAVVVTDCVEYQLVQYQSEIRVNYNQVLTHK